MIHNIPQPDFEKFIADHLSDDPNVEIRKAVGFVSCEQVRRFPKILHGRVTAKPHMVQTEEKVITTVEERDSKIKYKISSKHVIGCDGAKSQVRKSLGIQSEGEDSCRALDIRYHT